MKRKRKTKRISMDILYMPSKWFNYGTYLPNKNFVKYAIIFFGIGFELHQYFVFPYLICYVCIFCCIGLTALISIRFYIYYMQKVVSSIAIQKVAQPANSFYYKYVYKNPAYMLFSFATISIFGCGGSIMFEAASFDPLYMWVMILFIIVVYVSIIGYVQYIFLAVYIYKLASSKHDFSGMQHSLKECIPADIEWLQSITKLSHIYRTAFFTIGSLYIIAFAAFCCIPDFKVNCNSLIFNILWGIIFIAIVLAFPIISVLEYLWIKKIVGKIKNTYIHDIQKETNRKSTISTNKDVLKIQLLFLENIYALRIKESRDYPIVSAWNILYSICLSILNFIVVILTIFESIPTVLNALHQLL